MRAILVAVIVSLLIGLSIIGLVRANPNPGPAPMSIGVWYSPSEMFPTTLNVDITVCYDTNNCTREAWYSLDGHENVSIPLTFKGMIGLGGDFPASQVLGQVKTPVLSGAHTIKVSVKYDYGSFLLTGSKTLYVGQPEPTTPPPPAINVISPKNQATYSSSDVPITYSIDSKIIYSYYALDPNGEPSTKDWKYFQGNITLSSLPQGTHKIVISVKPEGKYSYPLSEKTVSFNVGSSTAYSSDSDTPSPTPSIPEFSWLTILPILLTIPIALAIIRKRVKGTK